MEFEHPIPQQISSYQFRLVGDMTLKQFFQVAAGALISLVLYASGMPGYVKWPLIIFSFLTGVAFAFFPLQDRPLATWIQLFIKAIYSPTLFFWKKGAEMRQFFKAEEDVQQPALQPAPSAPTPTKSLLKTAQAEKEEVILEKKEKEFLTQVEKHLAPAFAQVQATPQTISQTKPVTTQRDWVKVPGITPSKVKHKKHKEKVAAIEAQIEGLKITPIIAPSKTTPVGGAKQIQFSPEAAPPASPTKPNIIVGQVIDEEKNIVDSTILEIKNSDGRPVRALKSNKLGHFMIVTPLSDGVYEITSEKEGYAVDPLTFEAKGEIIPPFAIVAKKEKEDNKNGEKDIYNKGS